MNTSTPTKEVLMSTREGICEPKNVVNYHKDVETDSSEQSPPHDENDIYETLGMKGRVC